MDGYGDTFNVDEYTENILDFYRAGSVISYISMLMNIVIFTILCRKSLRSPATILMQGLAVADLLTAISFYGLEPIFQSKYICFRRVECYLPYPYCSMYHHLSILSFTFHNVSTMLTTCLGIQKVIAILFPVWTKNQLTTQKAASCCVLCFFLSTAIGIPRHFSIWLWFLDATDVCIVYSGGDDILEYSSVTYLLIQTILLTSCCLFMLISTIFIVYKLIANKFTGRMTEQRRQERRSVAMVIAVLIVFFITEVPKVILYLLWSYTHINSIIDYSEIGTKWFLIMLIQRYDKAMAILLTFYTNASINNDRTEYYIALWHMEGIRLFTIIGCTSNFIIYIMMSTKMRNEIVLLYKEIFTRCTHKDQINQIRENAHGRTQPIYKTSMITTEQSGKSCSHQIRRNTSKQQDKIRTHEMEMNSLEQPGQSHTHEEDMNTIEQLRQSRTHEVKMNTIKQPGQSHTQEVERYTFEQPGQSRAHEIEHQDQYIYMR